MLSANVGLLLYGYVSVMIFVESFDLISADIRMPESRMFKTQKKENIDFNYDDESCPFTFKKLFLMF